MQSKRSIRYQLVLNVVITCSVIVLLGLVFALSHWRIEISERNYIRAEVAAADSLRDIERNLLLIESRMKSVMLSDASPDGALLLLDRAKRDIQLDWDTFVAHHRTEHRLAVKEAELIRAFEENLPRMYAFFDRVATAYRVYDPVELKHLIAVEWFNVQDGTMLLLRELIQHQLGNADQARHTLDTSQQGAAWLVTALLFVGLAVAGYSSYRLYRNITRRIATIEDALDRVAAGDHAVRVPYHAGETEITRIAAAINHTVAELSRRHRAIDDLLEHQKVILASVAEGIYGVDAEGRITFANPAALQRLGYTEQEVIGHSSHELLHHHHADGRPYPASECPIALARRAGQVANRDDDVFFRRNGEPFPVEYTAAPYRDREGNMGGVVIFRDITERRARERQVKESIEQLRESNRRLAETQNQLVQAEKLAGIGQLAAGVAHEINNPIAFVTSNFATLEDYHREILGLIDRYHALIRASADPDLPPQAEALRSETDLEFLREDFASLATETRDGLARVKRIVRDLLDFSRVEADADQQDTDLHAALDAALNIAHNAIKNKANVIRDYGDIPPVRCNSGQIQQVFLNLATNAAQAIDERGTITVRTRAIGDEVCIEISDTGCGMDADTARRVFDPFFTTKPVGKGTGLGLSVSYSIVQNHGGRFEVDSIPARGSHFRVFLPLAAARVAAQAA